ncbi:MAG TPA: hypothetical protein VGG33_12415 [Polyangia bacterium]
MPSQEEKRAKIIADQAAREAAAREAAIADGGGQGRSKGRGDRSRRGMRPPGRPKSPDGGGGGGGPTGGVG